MTEHGTVSTYTNERCRCDECRVAIRLHTRTVMERRRNARVEIGGRMVAPHPARHGEYSTYVNHACRCAPCTEANRVYAGKYFGRAS